LKVDRRTQDVLYVPDPVCCLVGGIQPERLPELTREASVHDGLLPRFLWTYPDVPPCDWSWDERESDELEAVVALFRQLRTSAPLTLRPHPAARVRWAAWYDELKRQHATLPPLARELSSKLPPHLATCWLVLQSLHDPEGRREEALPDHLDAAITLVSYFQAHARRVLVHFGTDAPHVDTGLAGRVATILRRTNGWLTKTELWQALHRNVKAEVLDAALGALLAEDRVVSRTEGSGPALRTLWRWTGEEPGEVSDTWDGAAHSYEPTNQVAPTFLSDSFGSYESSDATAVDHPDTCCICGAPLHDGRKYQCDACAEEGVRRNAARFAQGARS
jgi:CRISPR-associated protein Cmr3